MSKYLLTSSPRSPVVHLYLKGNQLTQCKIIIQDDWLSWRKGKLPTWGDVFGSSCKRCSERAKTVEQQ